MASLTPEQLTAVKGNNPELYVQLLESKVAFLTSEIQNYSQLLMTASSATTSQQSNPTANPTQPSYDESYINDLKQQFEQHIIGLEKQLFDLEENRLNLIHQHRNSIQNHELQQQQVLQQAEYECDLLLTTNNQLNNLIGILRGYLYRLSFTSSRLLSTMKALEHINNSILQLEQELMQISFRAQNAQNQQQNNLQHNINQQQQTQLQLQQQQTQQFNSERQQGSLVENDDSNTVVCSDGDVINTNNNPITQTTSPNPLTNPTSIAALQQSSKPSNPQNLTTSPQQHPQNTPESLQTQQYNETQTYYFKKYSEVAEQLRLLRQHQQSTIQTQALCIEEISHIIVIIMQHQTTGAQLVPLNLSGNQSSSASNQNDQTTTENLQNDQKSDQNGRTGNNNHGNNVELNLSGTLHTQSNLNVGVVDQFGNPLNHPSNPHHSTKQFNPFSNPNQIASNIVNNNSTTPSSSNLNSNNNSLSSFDALPGNPVDQSFSTNSTTNNNTIPTATTKNGTFASILTSFFSGMFGANQDLQDDSATQSSLNIAGKPVDPSHPTSAGQTSGSSGPNGSTLLPGKTVANAEEITPDQSRLEFVRRRKSQLSSSQLYQTQRAHSQARRDKLLEDQKRELEALEHQVKEDDNKNHKNDEESAVLTTSQSSHRPSRGHVRRNSSTPSMMSNASHRSTTNAHNSSNANLMLTRSNSHHTSTSSTSSDNGNSPNSTSTDTSENGDNDTFEENFEKTLARIFDTVGPTALYSYISPDVANDLYFKHNLEKLRKNATTDEKLSVEEYSNLMDLTTKVIMDSLNRSFGGDNDDDIFDILDVFDPDSNEITFLAEQTDPSTVFLQNNDTGDDTIDASQITGNFTNQDNLMMKVEQNNDTTLKTSPKLVRNGSNGAMSVNSTTSFGQKVPNESLLVKKTPKKKYQKHVEVVPINPLLEIATDDVLSTTESLADSVNSAMSATSQSHLPPSKKAVKKLEKARKKLLEKSELYNDPDSKLTSPQKKIDLNTVLTHSTPNNQNSNQHHGVDVEKEFGIDDHALLRKQLLEKGYARNHLGPFSKSGVFSLNSSNFSSVLGINQSNHRLSKLSFDDADIDAQIEQGSYENYEQYENFEQLESQLGFDQSALSTSSLPLDGSSSQLDSDLKNLQNHPNFSQFQTGLFQTTSSLNFNNRTPQDLLPDATNPPKIRVAGYTESFSLPLHQQQHRQLDAERQQKLLETHPHSNTLVGIDLPSDSEQHQASIQQIERALQEKRKMSKNNKNKNAQNKPSLHEPHSTVPLGADLPEEILFGVNMNSMEFKLQLKMLEQKDLQKKHNHERKLVKHLGTEVVSSFLANQPEYQHDFTMKIEELKKALPEDEKKLLEDETYLKSIFHDKFRNDLDEQLSQQLRDTLFKVLRSDKADDVVKEQAVFILQRKLAIRHDQDWDLHPYLIQSDFDYSSRYADDKAFDEMYRIQYQRKLRLHKRAALELKQKHDQGKGVVSTLFDYVKHTFGDNK